MSSTAVRRVMPYKDAPKGSLFRVLKENGFTAPRVGVFFKAGNSHAIKAGKDYIFGLADMVRVIRFPNDNDSKRS